MSSLDMHAEHAEHGFGNLFTFCVCGARITRVYGRSVADDIALHVQSLRDGGSDG